MIFIQALEQMHARANDKVKIRARSSSYSSKPENDSVFLSDAANHAIEIDINSDAYTKVNANMSIEASLLQVAIQYLNKQQLPIYSLDELNLNQGKWHLALQLPPNTRPQHNNYYGLGNKQSPTDIVTYKFAIPVLSAAEKRFEFYLELRTARFTQKANQWPSPSIEPIKLDLISSQYSAYFLESLSRFSSYFFDQDGDENQTAPILASMQDKHMLESDQENKMFSGLRIWRCEQEALKIILLGEPKLGAIYVANLVS